VWNDADDEWCLKCVSYDVYEDDDKNDIENGLYIETCDMREWCL